MTTTNDDSDDRMATPATTVSMGDRLVDETNNTETQSAPAFIETTTDVPAAAADGTKGEEIPTTLHSGIHRRRGTGKGTYISFYRKEIQRIQTDSALNKRHFVPEYTKAFDYDNANDPEEEEEEEDHKDNHSDEQASSSPKPRSNHTNNIIQPVSKVCKKQLYKFTSRSPFEWCESIFPFLSWLKVYDYQKNLLQDMIAGMTVGVMVIPQSMSYAKLAGLPVQYGLYSAFVPVYTYAIFGSSKQLAVGPVAIVSLILATGLTHSLQKQNISAESVGPDVYETIYIKLAIQVSFLVGLSYIVLGVLRLGFITIFLSHSVISGFTTGAAVIIGLSQIKYFFGYDIPKADTLHEVLNHILQDIHQFNYKTFLVGMISLLMLVYLKHIGKTIPKFKWVRAIGPLTVTTIFIILNVIFKLRDYGIPVVGYIPKGLPPITTHAWKMSTTPLPPIHDGGTNTDTKEVLLVPTTDGSIFVTILSLTIVGFMESIAIAKQLASKHKYEINSSVELIGLGMSNFIGSMFGAYPVTGSFSRSAVNNESGATSGIAGIVTATIVALTLLFLTPVFEQLPLAVLASIVISGVLGLLDYEEAIYLWKVHKFDFGVWMVAFLGTMFLGVEIGLSISVGVSLLIVTYESAYPHTAVLGRLPGTTVYRNIKQYQEAEIYHGILMVRIDAPLYFANSQNVREKIRKYFKEANEAMIEQNQQQQYYDNHDDNDDARKDEHDQEQQMLLLKERENNMTLPGSLLNSSKHDTNNNSEGQPHQQQQHSQPDVGTADIESSEPPALLSNSQNLNNYHHHHDHLYHDHTIGVKYIILELSPVSHMDTTAVHILKDMIHTYRNLNGGVKICFSNPNGKVMERLVLSGIVDDIGREQIFTCLHDAVGWCMHQMDAVELALQQQQQQQQQQY